MILDYGLFTKASKSTSLFLADFGSVGKHKVKTRYSKHLKALGNNIREIRIKKGVTQEVLADIAGISLNSVNTIESGKLNPTAATLFAIADALEINVTRLF